MYKGIKLKKDKIIYLQIYNFLKLKIENCELNGKLMPIRKLANLINVSPSTISKAYTELESNGFVMKKEGSGVYVNNKKYKNIFLEDHMESETFTYGDFNPDFSIDLSSATPNETILPMKILKKSINVVLDRDKENAFLYEDPKGYYFLRKTIMEKLKKDDDIYTNIDNLYLVSGAQQGINLFSKSFLSSKDIVVVESPTYKGAIDTFKKIGCKIISVPIFEDGYSLTELKKILKKNKIKLFYTMTNFQNPTGFSMSHKKKLELLKLSNSFNFNILEDDSLSDLYFTEKKPFTLKKLDKNNKVIYIKSYSKIFMPGLKLACISLPKDIYILKKFTYKVIHSGLNQRAFQYLLENNYWDIHMEKARNSFKSKQILMYNNLKKIEDINFYKPEGGLSFWIKLPNNISSKAIYLKLLSKKIGILPGILFSSNFDNYIRVSFAQCKTKDIKFAIKELNSVIISLK